ncbi:MAG: hypothetical protein IID03_12900 [Candidatus Dadabacteria bacterium]|nr:hypothetical protein [Candidatus Dadabacteria bacterium]
MTDIESLKALVGGGISFYVIKELFKFIYFQQKQKKLPIESEMKLSSRNKITDTNTKVNEMHKLVTKVNDRQVPLIFQPNLDKSMLELNRNVKEQTNLLRKIADNGK